MCFCVCSCSRGCSMATCEGRVHRVYRISPTGSVFSPSSVRRGDHLFGAFVASLLSACCASWPLACAPAPPSPCAWRRVTGWPATAHHHSTASAAASCCSRSSRPGHSYICHIRSQCVVVGSTLQPDCSADPKGQSKAAAQAKKLPVPPCRHHPLLLPCATSWRPTGALLRHQLRRLGMLIPRAPFTSNGSRCSFVLVL